MATTTDGLVFVIRVDKSTGEKELVEFQRTLEKTAADAKASVEKVDAATKKATDSGKALADGHKEATTSLKTLGDGMKQFATGQMGEFSKSLLAGTLTVAAVVAGLELLKTALIAVKDFMVDAVKEYAASEEAMIRLSNAYQLAGDVSGKLTDEAVRFADGLALTTKYTDEEIKSAQALLVSLGGLRGEGLERATRATVELATGLNVDLHSAALMMAKGAEGLNTALRRYGITVDESLPPQEALAQAIDKIHAKWGGLAEQLDGSLAGAMAQSNKQWGELKEAVGGVLSNALNLPELFHAMAVSFSVMGEEIKKYGPALQGMAQVLMDIATHGAVIFTPGGAGSGPALPEPPTATLLDLPKMFTDAAAKAAELQKQLDLLNFFKPQIDAARYEAALAQIGKEVQNLNGLADLSPGLKMAADFAKARDDAEKAAKELEHLEKVLQRIIDKANPKPMEIPGLQGFRTPFDKTKNSGVDWLMGTLQQWGAGNSNPLEGLNIGPDLDQKFASLNRSLREGSLGLRDYVEQMRNLREQSAMAAMLGIAPLNEQVVGMTDTQIIATYAIERMTMAFAAQGAASIVAAIQGKKANEDIFASLMTGLANEAWVEALMEVAKGIAALATFNTYSAALHFKAAAVFGAVGTVAAMLGKGGGGGGASSAGGGAASAYTPPPAKTPQPSAQQQSTSITVYVEGHVFNYEETARRIGEEIAKQQRKAGRS